MRYLRMKYKLSIKQNKYPVFTVPGKWKKIKIPRSHYITLRFHGTVIYSMRPIVSSQIEQT